MTVLPSNFIYEHQTLNFNSFTVTSYSRFSIFLNYLKMKNQFQLASYPKAGGQGWPAEPSLFAVVYYLRPRLIRPTIVSSSTEDRQRGTRQLLSSVYPSRGARCFLGDAGQ